MLTYLDEWERLTERIGFWIDTDRAYRTMDTSYIESVWWSLAELFRRGLLYRSDKVVPYCPRCGTALSSHEVALGYRDVDDPSAFVRFPLRDGEGSLLVWTTTPWTLPANQAAAIHPDVTYAAVEHGDETLILAEPLVESVLGEGARPTRLIPGTELLGREYAPPFPFLPGAHRVVDADFVTTHDGTGIVHIAPAFGEDDMATARRHDLDAPNPVGPDGRFTDAVGEWAGRQVKEADPDLIDDLARRGLLLRSQIHHHSYPHCWRCGTPLLYYAKPSWYIRTTDVRERMLELNARIGWHPERVRDGRFGKWLEGNVDWAISRDRYWGTPLPLWRCRSCDRVEAVGSYAELGARSTTPLAADFDPHRPFVDAIELTCECGGSMHREPEVVDVWYDSGAMPFAQEHHPFSNRGDLSGRVPADFICEALDQTRGWFYSLLAESTLLFDETAYRNVVCLGLILDGEGQKMSKSKGNVIEPWVVLDRQGADAFRWYLLTAQSPWESFRFSLEAVDDAMRRFLLTLWNTHAFLVTYASLPDGWSPGGAPPAAALRPVDRWILSRLDGTIGRGDAAARGLRRDRGGPRPRGVPRRPEQLVRTHLAAPLLGRAQRRRGLGRRRRRLRDPARVPLHAGPAGGPVLPLRGRGDPRHAGRRARSGGARERPPGRLAHARRAPRPGPRGGDGGLARGGRRGSRGPRGGQDQGAPAARRGRRGLPDAASPTRSAPWSTWSPRSSTCAGCASSPTRASWWTSA